MKEGQQEFEHALQDMGYEITNCDGIIMALVTRDEYSDSKTITNIRKAAVSVGYEGSYGMRMIQEGKTNGNV